MIERSKYADMCPYEIPEQKTVYLADMAVQELQERGFTMDAIEIINNRAKTILEQEEREAQEKADAKQIVELLSKYVNRGKMRKLIVQEVLREHRTLQQSMFAVFMECIDAWSKLPENHYDLRNEYTVKTSKKMIEAIDGWCGAPLI